MRAVVFDAHGGPDRLVVREVPTPRPGRGEILVRVRAAAVNPADCKLRSGEVPFFLRPRLPCVPGHDIAGDVEDVGPGVSRFAHGDPVFGLVDMMRPGAYAELAVISAQAVALKPTALGYEEAACIPVCGLTALQGLRNHGHLRAGSSVLVNGAAGGVGTFAVQIARALGATVTGTCSPGSADLVRSLGAAEVIDYTRDDFTRREGAYDLVFDAVGTRSFAECARSLRPRGSYVSTIPSPALLLRTALTVPGDLLGRGLRAGFVLARPRSADLELLARFAREGSVRPVIDRVLPLEEARAAHAHVDTGHAHGKVVLRVA